MLRRVGVTKTDDEGRPTYVDKLKPNAEYVICEEWQPRAARPIKSRDELVSWIDYCVLGDLRTLELGMREAEGRKFANKLGGGNFLLAAGCCMALEYISFIYWGGEDATENVRRYADRFLKPVDDRYGQISDILWRSFRLKFPPGLHKKPRKIRMLSLEWVRLC